MSAPRPRLRWRTVLIDGPAEIVDAVMRTDRRPAAPTFPALWHEQAAHDRDVETVYWLVVIIFVTVFGLAAIADLVAPLLPRSVPESHPASAPHELARSSPPRSPLHARAAPPSR